MMVYLPAQWDYGVSDYDLGDLKNYVSDYTRRCLADRAAARCDGVGGGCDGSS
jgi:hypothetical protein